MKRILCVLVLCCSFTLWGTGASAVPLDLSSFSVLESVPGSVVESGGVVTLSENDTDAALYFYNDVFEVPLDATILSFDYDFQLGPDDEFDYLQFNVNYIEQWYTDTSGAAGFTFDMTPYQGTTISLDWGLIWGGDGAAETLASVYNIDLATEAAPVPEPCTIILMGTGLVGLIGIGRKKLLTASYL